MSVWEENKKLKFKGKVHVLFAHYCSGQEERNSPKCAVGIKGVDRKQIMDLGCLCVINTL